MRGRNDKCVQNENGFEKLSGRDYLKDLDADDNRMGEN